MVEELEDLDEKVKNLVFFLNTLPTVKTIGSCQGHDDGGETGEYYHPFITFYCKNNKVMSFLASLDSAYLDENELSDICLDCRKHLPHLQAKWAIYANWVTDKKVTIEEYKANKHSKFTLKGHKANKQKGYVIFSLKPRSCSFVKASDIWDDLKEILKYYIWEWKRVQKNW